MFYAVGFAVAAGNDLICCHGNSSVSLLRGWNVRTQMQFYTVKHQNDNIKNMGISYTAVHVENKRKNGENY